MTQREICQEITAVMDGIFEGSVEIGVDSLWAAMKPMSPVDALFMVYHDVEDQVLMCNGRASRQRLEKLSKDLKAYKKDFKCKALAKPISDLDQWLKDHPKAK